MKGLYMGELWHSGTCLERLRVLSQAGWDITPFDITTYHRSNNRLMRSMQHHMLWGPTVARFNRSLKYRTWSQNRACKSLIMRAS